MYAALTRQAILEAAAKLFVSQGFDGTSVDDLAHESQLSKGAVYHHFQDKKQIFEEVYRVAAEGVITSVVQATIQPDLIEPWDRANAAVRAAIQTYAAQPDMRSLLRQVVGVLGEERTRALDGEVAMPLIRGLLEELNALGQLQPVDIPITALMVFRLLSESSLAIALSGNPGEQARRVEVSVLTLLSGLRA
ncbi:TetR/AcrR family transcriptional regulator [Nocardia fluminea]|uniref:TetR/AcrR family transcriptional regulator n=1 Tax=Nocardia fluminea TaxID=134984 RepID=UPI00366ADFB4